MTVNLGILLALLCALATNFGFLWKHKGACAAPAVDWRHPIRSAVALYSSKWFALGMLVATGAWGFHVAAMALAPLSLVQTVISGGLVLLTVLAERFFGFQVGRRQVLGVALMAAGLVLLAITLPHTGSAHSHYSRVAMASFEAGLLFVGTMMVLSPQLGAPHEHQGLFLGGASGILFGVSDVAIKALTGAVGHSGPLGLLSPWLAVAIIASVVAFYASARGLQVGEAVPVITLTSAGANVSAIAGGIIVFGDPMASDPLGIVLQSLAFVLVIAAAAVMPAPMRAAEAVAAGSAA
jgi:drug/metabolite transporter (DMT)-like permease